MGLWKRIMDENPLTYDWQGMFARCRKWGEDRAEWWRRKGHEVTSQQLPSVLAPATEEQIAHEEARLGTRLPPSLRAFYLESNGHGTVGNSIWSVRGVEHIGWLRDVVPHLYDIVCDDDPEAARSLVVSGESDASWWLLDPGDVDARGEWRAGRWSSWNPGMLWIASDFFGLFEKEVSLAERVLTREKFPLPPPGFGRSRTKDTIGYIDSTVIPKAITTNYDITYVPVEGFASIVTISAPATARVGEWVPLKATRRSGPWTPVRREEVREGEIDMVEPPLFESEVAGNLSWNVDPAEVARFNSQNIPGISDDARAVIFTSPASTHCRDAAAFPCPCSAT